MSHRTHSTPDTHQSRSVVTIALVALAWLLVLTSPAAAGTLTLEGEPTQGGLLWGSTDPGTTVKQDDRAIRVNEDGRFLVGFGRDHARKSVIEANHPDGTRTVRELTVSKRKYAIQRIDNLPENKVSKFSEKALKRIREEAAAARKARSRDDARNDWVDGFIWPAIGPITGVYGSQRILNGKPRRPHFGVDVAGRVGAPVVAPADGIVTLAHPDMYFSGGTLIIDHGHHLTSSFLHLSRILVKEGQRVFKGDVIAEIGKTGRVTGPHLDWRMNLGPDRIDPQLLAGPMPDTQARIYNPYRDRTGWADKRESSATGR
ncbi:MAG: M23 family metallopeptidase [Gammaproteobacteria bacterium]